MSAFKEIIYLCDAQGAGISGPLRERIVRRAENRRDKKKAAALPSMQVE
jgi:hypothetical protein